MGGKDSFVHDQLIGISCRPIFTTAFSLKVQTFAYWFAWF